MKHLIRGVGAAAALLALTAGNAMAFGPFTNTQVCGGTLFQTCATLTTQYVDNLDGTSTLTIFIANTSTNGDTFTAFGIRDAQNATGTVDAALAADWSFVGDVNQLGGDPDGANPKYAGFETNGGINGGITNDGNTYQFSRSTPRPWQTSSSRCTRRVARTAVRPSCSSMAPMPRSTLSIPRATRPRSCRSRSP